MKRVIKGNIKTQDRVVLGHPGIREQEELTPSSPKRNGAGVTRSFDLNDVVKGEIARWQRDLSKEITTRDADQQEVIESAYNDGYKKGLQKGCSNEREDRIKAIDTLLKEAKRKSDRAIRGLEFKIIDLAAMMAEKIIRKSIAVDPEIVRNIVEDAMSNLIGSEQVVLKVSQEDYIEINSRYDQWLAMAGNAREFRIEVDKRLRRGDSIVETEGGIVDAVIAERIDVLVNELLNVSG